MPLTGEAGPVRKLEKFGLDERFEVLLALRECRGNVSLQAFPHEFDWIQVRTVWRQEDERNAEVVRSSLRLLCRMRGEIVQDEQDVTTGIFLPNIFEDIDHVFRSRPLLERQDGGPVQRVESERIGPVW